MPWLLCFPGAVRVSAANRSIGSRVSSRITKAFARTVFAHTKALERLGEGRRKLLRKAARQAVHGAGADLREQEPKDLDSLCARGQKFAAASPAQLTALRKAVQPVYDRLSRDRRTKEYLDTVTALVRDVPTEPPVTCKG